MPACKVWDLVKVPFSYTNRPIQQRRPALVIAVPQTPDAPDMLWVLMVTSAENRSWAGDVLITDLAAGLPNASVVRPSKIATIDAVQAEYLGRLSDSECRQVSEALRHTLDAALIRST